MKQVIYAGFGVAFALLVLVGIVSYQNQMRLIASEQWVSHTYQVYTNLQDLNVCIAEAESGRRAYILTGDPRLLTPSLALTTRAGKLITTLRHLTADNPLQQRRLDTIEPLIRQRVANLLGSITLYKHTPGDTTRQGSITEQGAALTLQIQSIINAMARQEDDLLQLRKAAWQERSRAANWTIGIGNALSLALLVVVFSLLQREIRRRTQTQAVIERQSGILQSILDYMGDGVVVADTQGHFLHFNPAAEAILHNGPGKTTSAEWAQQYGIFLPDTVTPYPSENLPLARAIRGESVDAEEMFVRPAEAPEGLWIEVTARPLRDTAGKLTGGVVVFRDVTVRKRAEEELRRARDAAEAATRAKSQFLANMSHELRTPLNAIIGFSEMLHDQMVGPLSPQQITYTDYILTSGRHLLQLINDILDLAKIEAGRLEVEYSAVDVTTVLRNIQGIIQPLALRKNITVSTTNSEDLSPLTADEAKLKQIMYNLLSNAVKFTPEGGKVTVTASLRPASSSDPACTECLQISVSDTGIGIRAEDQERIFGEFEQVDSTYARKQQGTGLGLSLTRKLVEMHGGRLWVESAGIEGQGSTFHIVLPLQAPDANDSAAAEPGFYPWIKASLSESCTEDGRPLILVVEDDPHAAELLCHYLSEAGYAFACTPDGDQAVQLARERRPAAITLDIMLPKKDGWAVLTELKAQPETQDIPVIIVSIIKERQLAEHLGALESFVKPVDRERLLDVLRAALSPGAQGTLTVLVVDDEPVTVEQLTSVLMTQGFQVLGANGGQEGIDLALEKLPDIIILDLLMPGGGGIEIVRRLRASPQGKDIPVIIYTAGDITPEMRQQLDSVQAIVAKSNVKGFLRELERLARVKRAA